MLETITVETSAGTSPPILRMQYNGVPFYYVKFHGFADVAASDMKGHNFVTMFTAFDQLGVANIIAGKKRLTRLIFTSPSNLNVKSHPVSTKSFVQITNT